MIIPILESFRLKIEELRTESEHMLKTENFVFYVVL
jgi:hypothetical protein